MNAALLVQYAVIALLVLASIAYMVRKLAPAQAARWQVAAAATLMRPGRMPALQRIGRWLQPADATGDCGSGCGACGSCGPAPTDADGQEEQPLTFHSRHR